VNATAAVAAVKALQIFFITSSPKDQSPSKYGLPSAAGA